MASNKAVESAPPDTATKMASDDRGRFIVRHSDSSWRLKLVTRGVLFLRRGLVVVCMSDDFQTLLSFSQMYLVLDQFALTLIHTAALARCQTDLRNLKPFQRFSFERPTH